jgi:uncharacterized protein YkwD
VNLVLVGAVLAFSAVTAAANPQATTTLNAFRQTQGRTPLSYSAQLERLAQSHADDMAHGGFFSHTGSDGTGIADRAKAIDYRFCFIAENIAKGQTSLEQVLQSWAMSPGHKKNMSHRKATEFALARAEGNIWVMVLAAPGC